MSRGDTSMTPSAYVPLHVWKSGLYQAAVMPSFLAVSAVSLHPTSRTNWAYTVLMDNAVAVRNVALPPPSPSLFPMSHPLFGVGLQLGMWNTLGAGYTLDGVSPLENAVASTKGLNDDPGCRPLPPPLTVRPSLHVGSTSIFLARLMFGHPPRARFTWAWLKSRPPTSAFTNPVGGSTDTSDMSRGALVPLSWLATWASAASCRAGSSVVWMRRPPRYTFSGPDLAMRYRPT